MKLFSKKHRQILLCLLACLAACCPASAKASQTVSTDTSASEASENGTAASSSSNITASNNDLSVSFTYGFDKSSKYGRKMNVIATVTNTGKNFSGTIGIVSVPSSDNEQTLYEVPCILAEGETKKIELTATISASNWPSLLIKDEKERVVLQKSFRVTMTAQQDIVFAGVLTEDADSISYISTAGLAKMFLLDETTLPSTTAGLDSLDIILISNFNTERLSDNQVQALLDWTKKGGSLVFGTGATAVKTLSAFQQTLFNGTIGDPEKRTTLLGMSQAQFLALKEELYTTIEQALDADEQEKKDLQEQAETTEETEDPAESSDDFPADGRISKKEIDSLTLQPMEKDMVLMAFDHFLPILSDDENFPLILKQTYGKGTVIAAAFELGMSDKYSTSMGSQLYRIIENNFSKTKQNQLNGSAYENYYGLSNALNSNGMNAYPHLKLYFLILIVYALFTGPVLYFLLKKLDKRHLLWGLMPASCLVCTAVIYLLGGKSRITEPYIHYVSFLKMDQTEEEALPQQEVYFNVTAPYNKKYSITLPNITDVDVRSNDYGISYSYDQTQPKTSSYYKTAFYQDGSNETTVIMNDYAAFHSACFRCTSEAETAAISGSFESELTLKKDFTVAGSLTNQLGFDLAQAVYICNGKLYILGSMKDGDTVSLKDCESCIFNSAESLQYNTLPSGNSPLEAIAGTHGWDSNATLLQRQTYFAFEYYFQSDPSLFSDSGRIIAVTENGTVDFLTESGLKTSGLQLLDICLAPPQSGRQNAENLEQSFSSVVEGNMDYPYYRFFFGGQTINYHIESPETVRALVYPKGGNGEFLSSGSLYSNGLPVFRGTISAYNLKTGAYDVLFTSGTEGKCRDLSPYISISGQLTLRYDVDNTDDNCSIPYLYLIRE